MDWVLTNVGSASTPTPTKNFFMGQFYQHFLPTFFQAQDEKFVLAHILG